MSQNEPSVDRAEPVREYHGGLVEGSATERSSQVVAGRTADGTVSMSHGHAAAVVASESELLAAALLFLDAGLREGDLVALNCPSDTVALICGELGERASNVESEPRLSLLGSRAPDALTMCGRFLERAASSRSGRLRVLSEVDFGRDPADWREGQRFE